MSEFREDFGGSKLNNLEEPKGTGKDGKNKNTGPQTPDTQKNQESPDTQTKTSAEQKQQRDFFGKLPNDVEMPGGNTYSARCSALETVGNEAVSKTLDSLTQEPNFPENRDTQNTIFVGFVSAKSDLQSSLDSLQAENSKNPMSNAEYTDRMMQISQKFESDLQAAANTANGIIHGIPATIHVADAKKRGEVSKAEQLAALAFKKSLQEAIDRGERDLQTQAAQKRLANLDQTNKNELTDRKKVPGVADGQLAILIPLGSAPTKTA